MPVVLRPARRKLTAIIEPAEAVYLAFCPELDLATEGDTPDSAVDDLIEMALDYADQYMADLERFSQSPIAPRARRLSTGSIEKARDPGKVLPTGEILRSDPKRVRSRAGSTGRTELVR